MGDDKTLETMMRELRAQGLEPWPARCAVADVIERLEAGFGHAGNLGWGGCGFNVGADKGE
jgi:hypothetical protein